MDVEERVQLAIGATREILMDVLEDPVAILIMTRDCIKPEDVDNQVAMIWSTWTGRSLRMRKPLKVGPVMSEGVTVREQDLLQVLKWLRDFRLRAIQKRIDPWAVRQGLLLILRLDSISALERGVTREALQQFDTLAMDAAEEIQLGGGRGAH